MTEPFASAAPAITASPVDAAALLDALPGHAAVADAQGRIVAVNTAWRDFAAANALPHGGCGLGLNYLTVCDEARGAHADEACEFARGLRSVLAGHTALFTMNHACHAPQEQRWFKVSITPLGTGAERGALVLHTRITAQIAHDAAVREAEARYRAMFERNALAMWVYDPTSLRFLAVNDAAVLRYGYSRDEFLGMTLADIRPPEDEDALRDDVARMQRDGINESHQTWRHRLKNGTLIQVEIHAHQVPWAGRPARLVMAQDVTVRVEAERALRESEQRFRQIADGISEVFWLAEDERLLYVSPAYETIWGRSRDSLQASSGRWLQTIHPDDRERVMRALPLQASGGYDVEYRIVRPDGGERWIADRAFPVPPTGDDAPGVQRLAGVARDVTESRANQARLTLLETAVARLNDIVIITEAEPFDGPGPRIVFVNDAFERLTGYRRDEVVGRTPRVLQGPATQRSELDRIGAALKAWQPVRAELVNYTKAGQPFWLELDIVPLANADGWYTHWVAIERDITERKQVEQQLQQSQRLESLGQLTGGVAHDFNNLLTVMLGNAELLAEQLPPGSVQQRLAQMIGDAAQRGADLTQRLLAFARKQALEPRAVDLDRLVNDMDGLLRRTLGEHIEIERVRSGGLWTTLVDPTQLENALLNLAINARDAMPGGGRLCIETANARLGSGSAARHPDLEPGDYVALTVSDTGCGIPADLLARVFEPFFTTKERGKGTGLGLAMVWGFVKQSRGHVAVVSAQGQGTTVRIHLPRHSSSQAAEPSADESVAPAGAGQLVLLVEDDAMVRDFARGQLQALGYRTLEAADGPLALALLRARADIDLLFTDVVMPGGMSGADLAAAAHALRPSLPVLFTSGYTESALTHDGRLDRDVLLLGKPYRRAELAVKLQEALRSLPRPRPAEA